MKINFNRKTAALILFSAAVFLLIANMVFNYLDPKLKPKSDKVDVNGNEIDSVFRLSLHNFGIHEGWIKENKRIKDMKSYQVKIPVDLSIPVILAELNSNYCNVDVSFNTIEKEFSGKTVLEISSNDEVKLKAEFNYDEKINRTSGKLAFLLSDFELSSKQDSLLLDVPEPFSSLLTPSTKNVELANFILSKNKTYALLLNDEISELKYKLKSSYSDIRIKGSLQSIIKDFSTATFFVIDDESDLFNSPAFTLINSEVSKRMINIVKLSELKNLSYGGSGELLVNFDNYVKETSGKNNTAFIVNRNDFKILLPEIKRYRKVGYVIVHPSEILLRRSE